MVRANQFHLHFVTSFFMAASAFVFHFTGLKRIPTEMRFFISVCCLLSSQTDPYLLLQVHVTTKEQNFLSIFLLIHNSLSSGCYWLCRARSFDTSGENLSNFSGFWIRPILASHRGVIHAENKGEEKTPVNTRAVQKPYKDMFKSMFNKLS